ncbi:hypothetical protein LTR17_020262 [Elasticomyces elasticus]|nr:hypothetical protein LTR17_020262 [Elasticomyces elasticus]
MASRLDNFQGTENKYIAYLEEKITTLQRECWYPAAPLPSDQQPREVKSAPYKDQRYETLLETKGSFMGKHEAGVGDVSKSFHRKLLDMEQTLPGNSLFRDDLFDKACQNLENKNEAKIVQDINRLIVPSAEQLALFGAKDLDILVESINEGWNNSILLIKTRPQPDYSAEFRRSAFTNEQLQRLQPFVGALMDTSYFMATYYMYFPFLTCEVKCGAAALDIADQQNAHSMTLAVKGVVELFRLAKREKEADRVILVFSISHDHSTVRIHGHYPVTEGKNTAYYRHPVRKFDVTEQDGKEKWTAYKFTKNVYDVWMTMHFARICSVIDELPPNIAFEVSERSGSHVLEATGLSQGVGRLFTESSDVDTHFLRTEGSGHGRLAGLQDITPNTSLSPLTGRGTSKGSKKRRTVTQQHPKRKVALHTTSSNKRANTLDLDTLMTNNDELYDNLNLSREASQEEVTASYKRLQRECHPDRVNRDPDSQTTERFCTVVKIYDILGNKEKRKKYDDEGLDAVVAEGIRTIYLEILTEQKQHSSTLTSLVKLESGEPIVLLKEIESLHLKYTSEALLKAGSGHQKPALKKLDPHSARYADWWQTIDKRESTHEEKNLLARSQRTIEWTEISDQFKTLERLQGRSVTKLKIAENGWKTCVKSYGFPQRWDQMVQEKFMLTTTKYPQSSFPSQPTRKAHPRNEHISLETHTERSSGPSQPSTEQPKVVSGDKGTLPDADSPAAPITVHDGGVDQRSVRLQGIWI